MLIFFLKKNGCFSDFLDLLEGMIITNTLKMNNAIDTEKGELKLFNHCFYFQKRQSHG